MIGPSCGHAVSVPSCRRCADWAYAQEMIRQAPARVCSGTYTGEHEPGCAVPAGPSPSSSTFAAAGRWRVYFNKHGRADLPWCIAPELGGWELAVAAIVITTEAETVYRPKATPDDEDGLPSAWIAIEGKLIVAAGRASIGAP